MVLMPLYGDFCPHRCKSACVFNAGCFWHEKKKCKDTSKKADTSKKNSLKFGNSKGSL